MKPNSEYAYSISAEDLSTLERILSNFSFATDSGTENEEHAGEALVQEEILLPDGRFEVSNTLVPTGGLYDGKFKHSRL